MINDRSELIASLSPRERWGICSDIVLDFMANETTQNLNNFVGWGRQYANTESAPTAITNERSQQRRTNARSQRRTKAQAKKQRSNAQAKQRKTTRAIAKKKNGESETLKSMSAGKQAA